MKGVLAAMKVRGMAVYGTSLGTESGHAPPTAGACSSTGIATSAAAAICAPPCSASTTGSCPTQA